MVNCYDVIGDLLLLNDIYHCFHQSKQRVLAESVDTFQSLPLLE